MKKPIWIKYILLALVAAMVLSLAACKDTAKINAEAQSGSEASSETEKNEESSEIESGSEGADLFQRNRAPARFPSADDGPS